MDECNVTYDFTRGEKFSYSVLSAADIDLFAQPKPGIYAWYLRVLPKNDPALNMGYVDRVFASKRMNVEVSGNLGERYQGILTKDPSFSGDISSFHDTVLTASTIFCPPLYIGISKNIKNRLSQHFKSLEAALLRSSNDDGDLILTNEDIDEDAESNVFGERIGRVLRVNNIKTVAPLFIKVTYPDQVSNADLLKAESYVNRLYVPICGRR